MMSRRDDDRERQQQHEPVRTSGLSWKHWSMIVAGLIAIIIVVALIYLVAPYMGWWGPALANVAGGTLIVCIPALPLAVGLHLWQENRRKNYKIRVHRPTSENAYPIVHDAATNKFIQADPIAPPSKVPQNQHYAPTIHQHNDGELVKLMKELMRKPQGTTVIEEEKSAGRQLMLPAPAGIPAMYDLMEAYHYVDVGPDNILLARSDRGEHMTVNADNELCHGVFNAVTGRGKTVVERGLASQLIHAEYMVTWLDLKFALTTENGLDYRPLAKKLWNQPPMRITIDGSVYEVPHVLRNENDIAAVLHMLAYDEIDLRLRMRDAGDFSFPTHFVFLEEMLAFIKDHPEAAEDVVRIIALGRELRIKLFTAAQNFLAKDTKLTGGAKENFETVYFLGGDTFSGAKVLDVTQRDLNEYLARYKVELGKGLTLLRNNTVAPKAVLARVGMASNDAIYYHHGRANDFQLPPRTEIYTPPLAAQTSSKRRLQLVTPQEEDYQAAVPEQPVRRPSQALSPQLQAALGAYQRGYTTSRVLAAEMNIGKSRANELLQQLKARKLIN